LLAEKRKRGCVGGHLPLPCLCEAPRVLCPFPTKGTRAHFGMAPEFFRTNKQDADTPHCSMDVHLSWWQQRAMRLSSRSGNFDRI
jgi:hypothetical protein